MLVLALLVLAIPAGWLYFREQRGRLVVGGPGLIQGDAPETVTDGLVHAVADAATQTVDLINNVGPDSSTLPLETFASDSFDSWSSTVDPAVVDSVTPFVPVLGPHLVHFVDLPWGWAALAGATVAGVVHLGPLVWPPRRVWTRPRELAVGLVTLPWWLLLGAGSGLFFLAVGASLNGAIAPFRVLRHELVVYLFDCFVPGVRNGRFSLTALFFDLTASEQNRPNLVTLAGLLVLRRPPAWWFTRGVAFLLVVVLVEHLYRGFTITTDVERYGYLLEQNVKNLEELHRIAHERHVWFLEHPPAHPGVRQDVQTLNEGLLRAAGGSRTGHSNHYKAHQLAKSYLLENSARFVKTPSLLERVFDQVNRLTGR